jgi:type II secretory pathway pseudopilin PulG
MANYVRYVRSFSSEKRALPRFLASGGAEWQQIEVSSLNSKEAMKTSSPSSVGKSSANAFTMVELLVVIAIILFLVGLLMPALQRVKETAKNVKCISNMRQLSMATFVYAADNDGFAPYEIHTIVNNELFTPRSHTDGDPTYKNYYPKNKWFAEYLPGAVNGKMNPVAYCPKGGKLGEIGPNISKAPFFNISYGINPDLGEEWWITNGNADRCSVPLSQVKLPAKTSLWLESNRCKTYEKGNVVSGRHFAKSKQVSQNQNVGNGNFPIYQYEGKMNVVFVDQHIGSIKFPDELPVWSCVFWMHWRPTPCNPNSDAGMCDWCDKGKPE